MKLVIQIPCFNEEKTLGDVLSLIPRSVRGIDAIETIIVNDGSHDKTVEVARSYGVKRIVNLPVNQGLARAFMAGLEASIQAGADIIVNIDADNQYDPREIENLIQPILLGHAEIVIGERPIGSMKHFSFLKRKLQRIGSWVVRIASQTKIPDAPSGFRAISREAAMRLHVFNEYTYTLEMIIQAGQNGMAVTSVPIRANPDLRPSRLVKSLWGYIKESCFIIVRIFMTYRPFKFFAVPGFLALSAGFILGIRFLYYYFSGLGRGHVQSVILAALLLGVGFFLLVVGLVTDLVAVNRKLLESIDRRVQRIENKIERK